MRLLTGRIFAASVFYLAAAAIVPTFAKETVDEQVDFLSQVAPILEEHCLRCHFADNGDEILSLSTAAQLDEQEYVVVGDSDGSLLIDVLLSHDGQPPAMPQDGTPLEAEEINLLRAWIDQGAAWPAGAELAERSKADKSWWSLQPITSPPVPEVVEQPHQTGPASWDAHPIDRFVFSRLAAQGLEPNPPADPATLIRRVFYDLTGLPPAPAEIADFVSSKQGDRYDRLLERLLSSPRYGERWGRHWLDVVRFGESTGYEQNLIIDDAWPFRDYVIKSFNTNKPFDQFIVEHLAGDCDTQQPVAIGTGFLVNGPFDRVGNQDAVQAAQIRANTIDEMIRATSDAFLGLTVGCARCHNHKFDPIQQRDYYRLYSIFSGVVHGSRPIATSEQEQARRRLIEPLEEQVARLTAERSDLFAAVDERAVDKLQQYETRWVRPAVARALTEEKFDPVRAKFVRLHVDSRDDNLEAFRGFRVDEFEVWSAEDPERNVASADRGAVAIGASRQIEDFPGAYGPQLAIDGKFGERFISEGRELVIELPAPELIDRITFSSARKERPVSQAKFSFVADYRIEVSEDGANWTRVADGLDRKPLNEAHRKARLRDLEITPQERQRWAELNRGIQRAGTKLREIAPLPTAWIGTRSEEEAKSPKHIFIGGSPQRLGPSVSPASPAILSEVMPGFKLPADCSESERRLALAEWISSPDNPLTARVLANRIWHYHFGTGLVSTPSDFGYMGSPPSHPELLDWLAARLIATGWDVKALHRLIMRSQTYRQSSRYREAAAGVDHDARLLWRFPPRRLSAEEIRDSILQVSGSLRTEMSGPGYRLYDYLRDNVATYVPLDQHGEETFRRAVYHQNARACRTDFMTDFDQPDCAFSTARRVETTTPLQALCSLNHDFALEMSQRFAARLERDYGDDLEDQISAAFMLCYGRHPSAEEVSECRALVGEHSLFTLCRALLNTSEFLYVE